MLDLKFNFKLQISLDVFNGKDEWHFRRNSKLCCLDQKMSQKVSLKDKTES